MSQQRFFRRLGRFTLFLTAASLAVSACSSGQIQVEAATTTMERDESEIVREYFEDRLADDELRIIRGFELRQGQRWTQEYLGLVDYDVTKTDSIVKPFVAEALFKLNWFYNGEFVALNHIEATYEYVDGEWVFVNAIRIFGDGTYNTENPEFWVPSMFTKPLVDSSDATG